METMSTESDFAQTVCDQNLTRLVQFRYSKKFRYTLYYEIHALCRSMLYWIGQRINLRQHLLHEERAIVNRSSELLTTFS